MVEHNLAKVGVASSNLVSRSILFNKELVRPACLQASLRSLVVKNQDGRSGHSLQRIPDTKTAMIRPHLAEWQSGYAAACKAVDLGSIPGSASKCFASRFLRVAKYQTLPSLDYGYSMPEWRNW